MAASGLPRHELSHVGDAPGDGGRGGGRRAGEVRTHFRALAVFEVAIGGRDAALPRLAAIAIAAGAHGAAGLAPQEPGVAEDAIEPGHLRRALHRGRPRHDHRDDARGDVAPAHNVGGGFEVRQAAVGARADEDAVDRQAGERHAWLQSHIGERALDRGAPALIGGGGIGHAAGNPEHLARVGAPGDLRLERATVEHVFAVERGAIVARERAPMRERAIPHRAFRSKGARFNPREGAVVRGHEARASAHLDIEVAKRHAAFDRHRAHRRAGIFHDVTARARDAQLGDDAQRHVLGGHKRAEASHGAGVAVGNRVRRARQHHAQLRRDHVRNALLRVVDVEKPDAVAPAAFAHRLEKGRARRVGGVVAAGLGGDGVVLHGEGQIRPAHAPVLLLQLLEGVQLVQHVPIDIDEVAAIGAPPHQVRLPDLVEQGLGHGLAACGLNFVADRSGAASWRHLGRADHPTQAVQTCRRRRLRPLFRATKDSGAIFGSVARAAIGELDASEQPGETSDVSATLRRSFSWEAPMSTDFVFTNYRSIFAVVGLLACLAASPAAAQNISWPAFGPERSLPRLDGLTDALPDFVGPLDGSAELTIFTEGNHYPVLLPLVLEAFPAWCKDSGACAVDAGKILIVTLPQPMVVDMLLKGGIRLGNAIIPIGRDQHVFPDLVMGGAGPLRQLADAGILQQRAVVFARHRGLGLLLKRDLTDIGDVESFRARAARIALASENEPGARNQYRATLEALAGKDATAELLAHEIRTFPGRLGIQHRDVPYAVLNDIADGGVIFSHLAAFYAHTYPDRLRAVAVADAERFGQELALAKTEREPSRLTAAFERFFFGRRANRLPRAWLRGPEQISIWSGAQSA